MSSSVLSGCPLVTSGPQVDPGARARPSPVLTTPWRRRRRSTSPTVKSWAARQRRVAAPCVMPHALSHRASRARCVLLALRIRVYVPMPLARRDRPSLPWPAAGCELGGPRGCRIRRVAIAASLANPRAGRATRSPTPATAGGGRAQGGPHLEPRRGIHVRSMAFQDNYWIALKRHDLLSDRIYQVYSRYIPCIYYAHSSATYHAMVTCEPA